jgi:hypothetical protein
MQTHRWSRIRHTVERSSRHTSHELRGARSSSDHTYRSREESSWAKGSSIWEACRATTAFPGLFLPIEISDGLFPIPFVTPFDYANPTELALFEARRIWKSDRHFRIISLGSGKPNKVMTEVERDQSQWGWVDSLIKLGQAIWQSREQERDSTLRYYNKLLGLYSGTEQVHYQMESHRDGFLIQDVSCEYYRLNVGELLGDEKFNHWRSMEEMKQLTDDYLEGDGEQIFSICRSMF